MKIKIEQETAFEKDSRSNAVLNVNTTDYLDFMAAHYARIQEKQLHEQQINSRINGIESEVSDIKLMLQQILSKLG